MSYKVAKVGIKVKNIEEALQFYHEVAGLPILQRFPREDGGENVFLDGGGMILELFPAEKEGNEIGLHHIAFGGSSPSMEEDVAFFRESGVEITDSFLVEDDIHLADMEDPDGMKIRLFFRESYQNQKKEKSCLRSIKN